MNTAALRKRYKTDGLQLRSPKDGHVLTGKAREKKLDALFEHPIYGVRVLEQLSGVSAPLQVVSMHDGRRDAQSMPIFAQQLEHIFTQTYEVKHEDLPAANGDIIPINTEPDEGADSFVWYTYDSTGIAKFIDAYNSAALPEGAELGAENRGTIHTAGYSYGWTTDDLRRARKANFQLQNRKSRWARRAHDKLLHLTVLWGDVKRKIYGLFNNPHISGGVAADNGSGSTKWVDKTPKQILLDVSAAIDVGISQRTNRMQKANVCLLASALYDHVKVRLMTEGQNGTILEQMMKIWSDVEFRSMDELMPANSQGNLSSQCIFAYERSEDTAEAVVAMAFTQYAPQQIGLQFTIPCESRIGGVKMIRPLAFFMLVGCG